MSKYRNIKGVYADDKTLSVLTKSKMKPESIIWYNSIVIVEHALRTINNFIQFYKRKNAFYKLEEYYTK